MTCGDDLVYTNPASGGRHSHQQTNMTNFRILDSVTLDRLALRLGSVHLLITLWAAYYRGGRFAPGTLHVPTLEWRLRLSTPGSSPNFLSNFTLKPC